MTQATFLTIGEAPRKDIEEAYNRYFEGNNQVNQAGLLDGLSHQEAETSLGKKSGGGPTLTSLFADGTTIVMDQYLVEEKLQEMIDRLEAEAVEVIAILCTGSFDNLSARKSQLVEADKVTVPYVRANYPGKRIGVVVPLAEQIPEAKTKWGDIKPHFGVASPYAFDAQLFANTCKELAGQGAEVIVLDCMGYTDQMTQLAEEQTRLPVVQSNDVLFQNVQEVLTK